MRESTILKVFGIMFTMLLGFYLAWIDITFRTKEFWLILTIYAIGTTIYRLIGEATIREEPKTEVEE